MNKIIHNKYLLCALAAVCVATCTLVVCVPDVAFAVSDDDKILGTDVPLSISQLGNIKYCVLQWIFGGILSFAINATQLANEFLNTITNNSLFTLGIGDPKFNNVMAFVGTCCEKLTPIGYYVLGIFVGIEALKICKDTKSLSTQWIGLGVMEAWLVFAIKFTVLYTLVKNAKQLMLAIYSLVGLVQTAVQKAIESAGFGGVDQSFQPLIDMANSVTFGDFGQAPLIALVALIALGAAALTAIYVQVLAVMRLFEIFILLAVSPVSISTLASQHTSSVGAGYIKTFIGAVLQISILFLIVAIAGPILGTVSSSITDVFAKPDATGPEVLLSVVTPIVTTIALFLMAKKSRDIADRLAGAA